MANGTTTRRQTTNRAPAKKPSIGSWFKQWLTVRDEGTVLGERQDDLRNRILGGIELTGEEDEKGNYWVDLPQPVEFVDHTGKKFIYTVLKRERHLRPANPTPDPESAEQLLRDKGLWLAEKDEKGIRNLQAQCPYVTISVTVDVDAVASAYFKGVISEEEYEQILVEQKESFQFRPSES